MKISKKLIAIICAAVLVVGGVTTGIIVGCSHNSSSSDSDKEQKYDPETRALTMSISTPDGVFNPYFSSSAYDSSIVSLTQISMLSTDKNGQIICGESEPTVAKDYEVKQENDYTTYEFLIKNGIKFSDGNPLTIKDVLFNLYVYLDPSYTGSATIYSTDIVGLKNYRMQEENVSGDKTESSFDERFVGEANVRIQTLIDYVTYHDSRIKNDEKPDPYWTADEEKSILKDFAYVAEKFKEELNTDWNAIDKESYKDWKFTEVWQIFLLNDGGYSELLLPDPEKPGYPKKDKDGNYQLNEEEAAVLQEEINDYVAAHPAMDKDAAIKEYCINAVYDSYFPTKNGEFNLTATNSKSFTQVVKYWATASTILDKFTADAKSDYFGSINKVVPNISGITTRKTTSFKGKSLGEEYDVLTIKINGVDPKAIYNFAFTVSPMHYYSTKSWTNPKTGKTKNYIDSFDGETEFGVEFGSIDFMNEVINAKEKVGLPLGAGAYKASNENGKGTVTGDNFFNNNMVYYERNTNFETVGKELSNAKIKYIKYKVVESDQTINALTNKDIDFGDPSATQDNINSAQGAGLGHVEIETSGYGYVGINPRFVPNINVRRAIMKAFNTQLILDNYYKNGLASIINRPMSKTSWAYPEGVGVYENKEQGLSYKYDSTGYDIEQLVKDAGYVKNAQGVYEKTIEGFGTDTLNYKFTIAGGSTDHPAYAMFLKAQDILNQHGFDVKVVTSQTALSDLSSGKLAVWAAAWSSTIDPDMYQVYHIDSQASSTSNWGYKQIKSGKSGAYAVEYGIITELSGLIDAGRATTDTEDRKEIYAKALDKIMELAVEFPTYQRKDMSAFNKDVLDEKTMTPASERSPYNGLLSRIWELNYL